MGLPTKINNQYGFANMELNGGKGSGNFGHSGRPGEVGGSGKSGGHSPLSDEEKLQRARGYADDADSSRVELADREAAEALGADLSDSGIEKSDKKMFWESVVSQLESKYEKRKDYKSEQEGVDVRDGYRIGTEFADIERELGNARTNLKMLQKDSQTAYDDLSARSRYLDRVSAMARTLAQATNFEKSKLSKETKKLAKEMAKEIKDIYDEYVELGTKKYFDPDLNVER